MTKVILIPGDGIGPEITDAVLRVIQAANIDIEFEKHDAGLTSFRQSGDLLPQTLIDAVNQTGVALKGPITTPVGTGFRSINVTMRQKFDLFQNIRPCKSIKGLNSKFENIDLVLFRENTEGMYSGFEIFDEKNGIADAIARISIDGSRRIIKAAFDYAVSNNRKKVTIIHKANIMKQSSGLFLKIGMEVAEDYPDIEVEDRIIDNMCMQLVMYPHKYDVLVTTNLFGDILSDLCAGLVGGLGIVPGANIGEGCAIFEAVHGSAPDIAGQNKANPTALLQSAIMMIRYLGKKASADSIEKALMDTLAVPECRTRDLGGEKNTDEFASCIIERIG